MKLRNIIAACILAGFWPSTSPGAMMELVNGRTFECEILSFSNGVFHVDMDGIRAQVPADQVRFIDFVDTPQITLPGTPTVTTTPGRTAAPGRSPIAQFAGMEHREPDSATTPGEIRAEIFRFDDKLVRMNIHWRGPIEQIKKDEYKSTLYDGTHGIGIVAYFDDDALRYMQSIQSSSHPRRTYTLYGMVLSQDKLASDFGSEYRTLYSNQHGFVPVGRRLTRSFGSVEYSW